ncbi:MAG: hypothetical protein SPF80_04760 [Candidatus Cryptobacteroides sp.]|nr:hypothetical protein [Bacteroidales bacterium]MDY5495301.1 hypothetical protein [Candidatus Cryptobacteroides sp.]
MRKHIILALVCCASVLAGCQKEMTRVNFESGLPASLDVLINLGKGSDVVMTRGIYDYESEINELMLIMFSEEGRKMVIDLTGKLDAGSAVTDRELGDSRTYKLTAPVTTDIDRNPILSGIYEIYAVANWSSPFCGLTKDKLAAMDKAALAAAVASNSGLATGVTGSQKFPMTGHVTGQKVVPDAEKTETNKTSIEVSLKRLISHIEFSFVNGQSQVTTGVDENPQFVPHSYSVYNLPKKALLMGNGQVFAGNEYGNVKDIEVTGSGGIEFFMLENVQAAGTSTTYEARDVWTGTQGAAPENKTWTNAPANSTFIVVKGEYTGASYIGNVEYTIHLGNFSAGTAESYNNFSVKRNEYQKYRVTVNGVNKIVTEVTGTEQQPGTEEQPGAEGVITAVSNQTNLVLDSHYESCLLTFSLSGCQNPTIIVKSPYNAMNRYEVLGSDGAIKALSGVDYGWVKFGKPASKTSLNAYPANGDGLVDIRQLALELKTAEANKATTADHFLISNGKVYVQAYVDEYYYSKRPDNGNDASWPEFVNAENRVLILNPTSKTSADGNSTLYPTYLFQISQRSIRTTYKTDNDSIEAFGIETWNETGRSDFGTAVSTVDLDDSYGWNNNKILLGVGNSGPWPDAAKKLGYTTSVTSNAKEAHVWFSQGIGVLDGYYACLSRNRDENGNGQVDADELKWYLPAINQYLLLWCGENYLYGDTRLVDPADIPNITNANDYGTGKYNLFTSSTVNEYWAVEGVSYGTSGNSNGLRCIRNLKTYNAETARLSESNTSTKTIRVVGARTLRQQVMTGEYRAHRDRDEENTLFGAFKVATSALGATYTAEQIRTGDLCSTYSEESDRSDAGAWRIPNQKELMLMSQNGYLDDISGVPNVAYASRTWFVNYDKVDVGASRGNPYYYWYYQGVPNISISTNDASLKFSIRCVRDVVQ